MLFNPLLRNVIKVKKDILKKIYKKDILKICHFKTAQFVKYLNTTFCLRMKRTVESRKCYKKQKVL